MIDKVFNDPNYAMSKAMLDVTAARHEAIASNIAHVNMPGYQRVDVSQNFIDQLQKQFKAGHPGAGALPANVVTTDPNARSTRVDGNNVELDSELLQMGSNEMQYEVLTEFVSNSLSHLKAAITGQPVP